MTTTQSNNVVRPPSNYTPPTLPTTKYKLNTAQQVFKNAIDLVMPGLFTLFPAEHLLLKVDRVNLTDKGAVQAVNVEYKQTTKDGSVYILNEPLQLTIDPMTLEEFFVKELGFARYYDETQFNDVLSFIPDEGFSHVYDEEKQELTITVDPVASSFSLTDDNDLTLITTLFVGQEFVIRFVDKPINLAEVFKNRNLGKLFATNN